MSFISRDLYLEVLGNDPVNRQSLYADYYKPRTPETLETSTSRSQPRSQPPSASAVNTVFSPKKHLPFKTAVKSFQRKVSGESFAEYDYYENLSIKEPEPFHESMNESGSSHPHPYRKVQQLSGFAAPASQPIMARPVPPNEDDAESSPHQEWRKSMRSAQGPSQTPRLLQPTATRSRVTSINSSTQPRLARGPTNRFSHTKNPTKHEHSYLRPSHNPISQSLHTRDSSILKHAIPAPSISESMPPSYRTQDLDDLEPTPRFVALPLLEPEGWEVNDHASSKKSSKLKSLFKRHGGDSDSHSWWVTVSPRKQHEKLITSPGPSTEHYRQGSEQMLMRWQRPEGPQITEICESSDESKQVANLPNENKTALARQMQVFSHVSATIKRVKIMRIIFSPIDTVAEQFPSLQSIVVIVEIIIFGWILYEISLLIDALCMTVKAVCAPIIAVGKFMNRIM